MLVLSRGCRPTVEKSHIHSDHVVLVLSCFRVTEVRAGHYEKFYVAVNVNLSYMSGCSVVCDSEVVYCMSVYRTGRGPRFNEATSMSGGIELNNSVASGTVEGVCRKSVNRCNRATSLVTEYDLASDAVSTSCLRGPEAASVKLGCDGAASVEEAECSVNDVMVSASATVVNNEIGAA